MTHPDEVAQALSRLAIGAPPTHERHPNPARVVADAEAAMAQVDHAAALLDADGESRLRRAVDAADTAGDDALAARGRGVLRTLAEFRAAVEKESAEFPASAGGTTSTALAQRSSGGES